MKFIGYASLTDMMRAAKPGSTVYMRSNVCRRPTDPVVWCDYEVMVQVERGVDVLYWLLNLGSEPEGVPHSSPVSKARLAASAREVVEEFLLAKYGVRPHEAMISYPKDNILHAGDYDDFMVYDKVKGIFQAIEVAAS